MTDIDLAGRLDAVVRIIQDPASNLTAVALLAAIVTLIVLIAVLMLLRFMLGGQATGTRDALDRTAEGSGPLEEAAGASDRRAGG